MSESTTFDYVIVGGGLSGCALASRLRSSKPDSSILVVEAGPDPAPEHDVVTPLGGFALQGSALDWQFPTAATPSTAGRTHTLTAGKTLGGGSMLNYGGWSRGDPEDYDTWARRLGGDDRWSYAGLLPYFKRSERFFDANADKEGHGFEGPLKVTPVSASHGARKYPLRNPIEQGWKELGVEKNPDPFVGGLAGLSEYYESWVDGKRRPAQLAYPLGGVTVKTSCPALQILFEKGGALPRATGVKLANGETITAKKEIVLSAGSLQTPRLLLRSGVGDPSTLSTHGVPLVQPLPGVGQQYFDHFALFQWFKLKDPSRGLAVGHPNLSDPAFVAGMPADWNNNEGPPRHVLEKALDEDGVTGAEREALLQPGRVFVEILVVYHPLAPAFPLDGSIVCTSTMLTLPSSRGRVSLAQDVDSATPLIEPNYFTTALDRVCLIHGVRRVLKLMLGTEAMKGYVESEAVFPGLTALTPESSDSEIEDRIRAVGVAHFHAAGSCPMGTVVDGDLKVKGVQGLRICDASIFPAPVGGHPMASLYGVAEQAADIIAADA
ncbi:GMC oxidoreductase [Annulohypoxylon truncatum]|uniref:GMC oxidoreductase n=1 Tax=Annulohypoxylon truncatum TaxID=327061 RepID=UPI0020089110|nr:GMC oxidoreductase [Annulohypoxylon truncatum]KAI1206797.1 GMC oxidoreductase [Annulohypoxylon truncatum]